MAFWGEYEYYKPSKPIEVKGGIKAKSKRGGFALSWWAKRWIQTLESFNIGARLNRGKSYARKGQVTSIKIETGLVRAKVQGSNPNPYSVTIKVRTLTGSELELLAEKLAMKPIFAAKLLAGEMPEDIETVFKEAGLSLFPEKLHDLETDCSCPDWSNPCKHIAAVYYLLGEEFDRDPFLIFKLRGVDLDDFMSIIEKGLDSEIAGDVSESGIFIESPEYNDTRDLGYDTGKVLESGSEPEAILEAKAEVKVKAGTKIKAEVKTRSKATSEVETIRVKTKTRTEPTIFSSDPSILPSEPETFWGKFPKKPEEEKSITFEAYIPKVQATLPKRLGKFPFWSGEEDLLEVLEEIYSKASPEGRRFLLGKQE